jgi:RES domain-containing protein
MAAKPPFSLPSPPADLASRKLPLTRVQGTFYRIHRTKYPAVFFAKSGRSRFDDPRQQYGVLYAALKRDAAFAEALLRQISLMVLRERDLAERSLAEITIGSVLCVNLTAHGLRRLSCDNRIADELPYRTPQLWSRAFFEHPCQPAGILYRSRHNPQLACLALFSRIEKLIILKMTTPLMHPSLRLWTAKQLKRYQIACLTP